MHEKALGGLIIAKEQRIQDLAHKVRRLTKHAYPELSNENRERFAITSFLRALDDRNTTFHIKEKDPKTLQEACDIYERYQALLDDSNIDASRRKPTVKVITSPEDTRSPDVMQKVINDLTSRVNQLTELVHKPVPPTPPHQPAAMTAMALAPTTCSQAPVTPCPRCKERGHWASDCPRRKYDQPRIKGCFECGEDNHFRRNCPRLNQTSRNARGPASTSIARPMAPSQRM